MKVSGLSRLLVLAIIKLGVAGDANAQLVVDHKGEMAVRGFHGQSSLGGGVRRSFQSDAEAKAELNRILNAVGLIWIADRIALRATADTANAEAGIAKNGERFIFYNATFMQKLKQKSSEQWSLVSVLAHELGHHLAFHTELTGNDHKYELEADYFSGFVLRRLGANLDQSHGAMRAISPKEATPTHPALDQRLQVITVGWTDGGGLGAPKGLKERAPPASPQPSTTVLPPAASPAQGAAAEAWPLVKDSKSIAELEAFVRRHGDTFHGDLVQVRLDDLKRESAERQRLALLEQQKKDASEADARGKAEEAAKEASRPGRMFRDCPDVCPEMVVVSAGSFLMGSPKGEEGRSANEGPQRKVTIGRSFAVGKFEVTFAEWDACVAASGCKLKPGDQGWGRGRRPVINVTWDDVTNEFLPWLAKKSGHTYRLPTEAEWEYAARAGTTTAFSTGETINPDQANFDGNSVYALGRRGESRQKTINVGHFNPNAFGLHDMHGNVWEWVQDCYRDKYDGVPTDGRAATEVDACGRVVRGGSWLYFPGDARSASRVKLVASARNSGLGFRLARTLDP
jgi:formylglycine-generating enzyme required for sulfatase activity